MLELRERKACSKRKSIQAKIITITPGAIVDEELYCTHHLSLSTFSRQLNNNHLKLYNIMRDPDFKSIFPIKSNLII